MSEATSTWVTTPWAGQAVLDSLAGDAPRWGGRVEFLDGGTQGIMLLGRLEGRRGIVLLDAVRRGSPPGTVHVLEDEAVVAAANPHGSSAHEANAGDLLRAAALLKKLPERVSLVGIEPGRVETGYGLTPATQAAVEDAVSAAAGIVDRLLEDPPRLSAREPGRLDRP